MITINGKTYNGNNVQVINNQVWIDGILQDDCNSQNSPKEINITVENCNINTIKCDNNVNIIGMISGDVNAGGSIRCHDINGNVNAGGSIHCNNIGGNVSAGGSIHRS